MLQGMTRQGRYAAVLVGLGLLTGTTAGCPSPKAPPPRESDLNPADFDVPEPESEPPQPPPEAGVVELGPAMMTGGTGMSTGAKDAAKEAFLASFENGKHLFRRCYAQGLERNAELAGAIDIEVILNATGKVVELKTVSVELDDPGTVRCVKRALRELSYQPLDDGELFSITPVVKFRPE